MIPVVANGRKETRMLQIIALACLVTSVATSISPSTGVLNRPLAAAAEAGEPRYGKHVGEDRRASEDGIGADVELILTLLLYGVGLSTALHATVRLRRATSTREDSRAVRLLVLGMTILLIALLKLAAPRSPEPVDGNGSNSRIKLQDSGNRTLHREAVRRWV